jgi:membrane protein
MTLKENFNKFKFVIKEVLKRYGKHSISAYSAQMAFFFILALFPFLIFLFLVLGKLSVDTDILIRILQMFFPSEVQSLIMDFIRKHILVNNMNLISFSIIGTLWSASKGVRALMVSLNNAYEIQETRNFLLVRTLDMVYTVLIVIGIVVLLTLPNIGTNFFNTLNQYIPIERELIDTYTIFKNVTLPIIIVVTILSMYKLLPNTKIKIKTIIWGSLFAIAGWFTLSYVFTIFLDNFANYSVVYGSLTTVIILMLWLYFSGIILIVGGEINAVIHENRNSLFS